MNRTDRLKMNTLIIDSHEDGAGAAAVPCHDEPDAHPDVGEGGQGLGGVLVDQGVHVIHLVTELHPAPWTDDSLSDRVVLT